jgi:4-amino-4-deoxy-L-arabinose transferase-like glycosyltransferase
MKIAAQRTSELGLGIMSLTSLTIIPLLLLICWIVVEFRCRIWVRVVVGFAALVTVAVMAFLWGGFTEAFKHTEFPVPHDSPPDTTVMDAAEKSATNNVSR